jgi:hypothetical protein
VPPGICERTHCGVASKSCSIRGCPRVASRRGLCAAHYQQWMNHTMSRPTCSVEGCQRPQYSWKMCEMHYRRVKRSGETAPTTPYVQRVDPDADDDGEVLRNVSEVKVVSAETVQYWIDQAADWKEAWEDERRAGTTSDYERARVAWLDWSTPTQRWVWGRGRYLHPDGVTPGPWDPESA